MPHILVVDDDREIRDLLAKFLERQRLRVTAARDGKEARRAFINGHFQLVVLDLMMAWNWRAGYAAKATCRSSC